MEKREESERLCKEKMEKIEKYAIEKKNMENEAERKIRKNARIEEETLGLRRRLGRKRLRGCLRRKGRR